MKHKRGIFSLIYIIALLSLFACTKINTSEKGDKVNLQLKWINQAQFAGYYVAKEKGFYKEENIEINIIPGGVGIDGVEKLLANEADFSIVAPEEIITAFDKGDPLQVISVIFQKNPFLLVTLQNSNINTIQDFNGKSIAISNISGETQFLAMVKNTNLDIDSIKEVSFDMDYDTFYSGEVDIYPAFSVGSYLDIVREGIEVNEFWPDDYGVHWYSDCIIVNQSLIEENPDLIERFLRATIKGMNFIVSYPDESLEIIMQYADLQDEKIQKEMLYSMIPLIYDGENPIGWMSDEKWQGFIDDVYEIDLIDNQILAKQFVNFDFLNNIYGSEE